MKEKIKTNKFLVSLIFVFTCLLSCILAWRYIVHVVSIRDRENFISRTTPLPQDAIETLCNDFNLTKDNSLCNGTKDVYAFDFYDIMRDAFKPFEDSKFDPNETAAYQHVESKIGVFKYECEPPIRQADGFSYFECNYDFQGDREFINIMYSLTEEAVFRINTPMGLD
jgi:hypothetical protein